MPNTYFSCKQFTVQQAKNAMKVTTDGCLFGAWVAEQLNGFSGNVLDIGAGTGILSLQIAQQSNAKITAIEIDPQSAQECAENFTQSVFSKQCEVVVDSIQNFAENSPDKYDCIISNPPFYEANLQSENKQKNTAHHSTQLTLQELLLCTKKLLTPQTGTAYFLLPYFRLNEFSQLAAAQNLGISTCVTVYPTLAKMPFRVMLALQQGPCPTNAEQLVIKTNNQYSPAFTELLKPYYLQL